MPTLRISADAAYQIWNPPTFSRSTTRRYRRVFFDPVDEEIPMEDQFTVDDEEVDYPDDEFEELTS